MTTNACLDAALEYAARGLYVFPVPPGTRKSYVAGKKGNGRRWGATTDPELIRSYWSRWPSANVGIATGRDSGIFVLDVDSVEGHGVDGFAGLKALGEIPPMTPTVVTPSGGKHFYFLYPIGIEIRNSTSKIAAGCDIRAEGGMVVAPPSIVPGKGQYRWEN